MNDLEKERANGAQLAALLVEHVKDMGAASAEIPVGEYVVIVKPK
jgi:hypothetical protein